MGPFSSAIKSASVRGLLNRSRSTKTERGLDHGARSSVRRASTCQVEGRGGSSRRVHAPQEDGRREVPRPSRPRSPPRRRTQGERLPVATNTTTKVSLVRLDILTNRTSLSFVPLRACQAIRGSGLKLLQGLLLGLRDSSRGFLRNAGEVVDEVRALGDRYLMTGHRLLSRLRRLVRHLPPRIERAFRP